MGFSHSRLDLANGKVLVVTSCTTLSWYHRLLKVIGLSALLLAPRLAGCTEVNRIFHPGLYNALTYILEISEILLSTTVSSPNDTRKFMVMSSKLTFTSLVSTSNLCVHLPHSWTASHQRSRHARGCLLNSIGKIPAERSVRESTVVRIVTIMQSYRKSRKHIRGKNMSRFSNPVEDVNSS